MKRILFTLVIAASFTFTGCIDVLEEMFLNKDGSGKYVMTIDMSSIMEKSTREMLKSMQQAQDGEDEETLGALTKGEEMDSIIYMKDLPAEERGEISRPEFFDKVSMRIQSSEKKELLKMSFMLDFENADDIDYFLKNFDKMIVSDENGAEQMAGLGNMGGGLSGLVPAAGKDYRLFDLSKKLLVRHKMPKPDENELKESEEMAMMKMFLASANYKTVYHFPGKVKKATNAKAVVDGKMVTIEGKLIDVMEGKADLSTSVKFKRR